MALIMRILGATGGLPTPHDGQFLVSCDVNARDGRGTVVTSPAQKDAHQFLNMASVHNYYTKISDVTPLRDDGCPNRPLTAFHVEVTQREMMH